MSVRSSVVLPSRRHRALAALLAFTGLASTLTLIVAIHANIASNRAFHDVNTSGSLRMRSLWVYGETHSGGQDWRPQVASMGRIRDTLSARYPQQVAETDSAWQSFVTSLRRTGTVNWSTANVLRVACNGMTDDIEAKAASQDDWTIRLLGLGLVGLGVSGLAACGLLQGLKRTEEAQARLAAIVEGSADAIIATALDGTITS